MDAPDIQLDDVPDLQQPLLIAGFFGWGNALNVATDMADHLVEKLEAKAFARINPDVFYRFDQSRPIVQIEEGRLTALHPPGGTFFYARTAAEEPDLVILKADEPALHWKRFADELFALGRRLGGRTLITLGSMYDNVMHSDRRISGMASSETLMARLEAGSVNRISYEGPSAIHSLLQMEGAGSGYDCVSIWSHCPYYLQGTSHYGLLAALCSVLKTFGGFSLDPGDLEERWGKLSDQIEQTVKRKPELQRMIEDLRQEKRKVSLAGLKAAAKKDDKVINLQDFFEPK
ncbi:MAG: hypothetical protein AMJ54_03095 [Deltaproteobacteria bacterium SG8_13]|nr:MAG: hypothetical protein AMJ54_03095 [Deltaproteobacteria bacterium SG8_13]